MSLDRAQYTKKRGFEKQIRPPKPVTEGRSVFFDVHHQTSAEEKLHHPVASPFRVLSVGTRTTTIRRGYFVARATLYRLVNPHNHLFTSETIPHSVTASEMRANNTGRSAWTFKLIVAPRWKSDGSLQFKINWECSFLANYEPRANIPEESTPQKHLRIRQQPL